MGRTETDYPSLSLFSRPVSIDKRQKRSRQRDEDEGDITWINEKNRQFNRKLSRYYDDVTRETRENFERGLFAPPLQRVATRELTFPERQVPPFERARICPTPSPCRSCMSVCIRTVQLCPLPSEYAGLAVPEKVVLSACSLSRASCLPIVASLSLKTAPLGGQPALEALPKLRSML